MVTLDANIWVASLDPIDRFHSDSVHFLSVCAARKFELHGPAFLLVEVGCAIARRARSSAAGERAVGALRRNPALILHSMGDALVSLAAQLGASQLLRGADAIYVATAATLGVPLVTWDETVIVRSGAVSPNTWLDGLG